MEKLSIEQKAKGCDDNYKVYTELINRLEDVKDAIKKQNYGIAMDVLCKPYPEFQVTTHSELKESEDERIRKFIANELICLRAAFDKGDCRYEELSNAINWLEKHEDCQKKINHAYAKGLADAQKALKKQGECHISHDDEIMIKQLTEYFTTGHGLQNTNGTVVEWLNDVKEKLEKQGKKEVKSTEEFETFVRWFVKQRTDNYTLIPSEEDIRKWADLILSHAKQELEKQGEQKPIDKVEPKFKVGDWITMDGWNYHIDEVLKSCYNLSDINGNYTMLPHFAIDDYYRPWTIQDAKDGDVLFTSSTASHETFILKSIDEKGNARCYFAYDSEDSFREGKYHFIGSATKCKPATKEQRDLLFQKMKEAGYEWNTKKKKLKKLT